MRQIQNEMIQAYIAWVQEQAKEMTVEWMLKQSNLWISGLPVPSPTKEDIEKFFKRKTAEAKAGIPVKVINI